MRSTSSFSGPASVCWPGLLLAMILLGGCSTLSKDECLRGDWQYYGYYDGTQGYPASRIQEHREACAEFRVVPDPGLYARGRERGLLEYCTPANGFKQGKAGASYHNVCRPDMEPGFLRNFRLGTQIHEINEKIRYVEGRIRSKERELEKDREKDKDNDKKDKKDKDKDRLSDDERRHLRGRIRDLDREKSELELMRRSIEVTVVY